MQLTKLGYMFKEKRAYLGKTQFMIAEMANIDPKHYGKIERSECLNPGIITFLQICYALDIEPTQLLKEVLNSD